MASPGVTTPSNPTVRVFHSSPESGSHDGQAELVLKVTPSLDHWTMALLQPVDVPFSAHDRLMSLALGRLNSNWIHAVFVALSGK